MSYGDTYHVEFEPTKYEDPRVPHHLPYKYPYKYQYGRHAYRDDFTIPCERCEPYEEPNRKKLPRLLLPWPLSIYTKDRQRPFPDNSYIIFTPTLIVPFIPFGSSEFALPMGFDANYLVQR